MKSKVFKFKWYGKTYKLYIVLDHYVKDNSLAVVLIEDKTNEQFAVASVCLYPTTPSEGCFFVDTNNLPGIEEFLVENEIAFPTGMSGFSGYCIYPEYKLNKEVL
jgi:hypothetical protein